MFNMMLKFRVAFFRICDQRSCRGRVCTCISEVHTIKIQKSEIKRFQNVPFVHRADDPSWNVCSSTVFVMDVWALPFETIYDNRTPSLTVLTQKHQMHLFRAKYFRACAISINSHPFSTPFRSQSIVYFQQKSFVYSDLCFVTTM